MWNGVKIMHDKPRHSQTQGAIQRTNQDIQNILRAMIEDNDTRKWSDSLPFVQFTKNTIYHQSIKRTPYIVMFGTKRSSDIYSFTKTNRKTRIKKGNWNKYSSP